MKEYKTVLNEASAELVEKRSRFICSVKPVDTESDALCFIRTISENYKEASHNVYAYVIAGNVEIKRASDDGEPQGTAGIPVLEVIVRENLTNVCVVVTRYFGGTLLGAGGLIRAYSAAARIGIIESKICTKALYGIIDVNISYSQMGKVQNIMVSMGNNIINTEYSEIVKLLIKVKHDRIDYTISALKELTCGEVKIELVKKYYDVYEVK